MSSKETYIVKSSTTSGKTRDLELYSSVTVAQNEPTINQVMNRSLSELLANDYQIDELNKIVFSQLNITDYQPGKAYDAGDLVWYKNVRGKTFLLQCTKQNNTTEPATSSDAMLKVSGWENQNKNLTILDYGIREMLDSLSQETMSYHENDKEYHPFGKISLDEESVDYIGNKLLQKDMSNINSRRTSIFFPQQVKRLDYGEVIVNGFKRDFGKIIEYDIILKLANSSTIDPSAERSLFGSTQQLSANNVTFELFSGLSKQAIDYQQNKNYFKTVSDMNIFQPPSEGKSQCGMSIQLQRNDYVNTYSAKILFPTPFADLNYMVFSNTILSQSIGQKTMVPSQNDIAYCDKTRQSITFIDITFPNPSKFGDVGYNSSNGGLVSNSFHMKMIGQKHGA